MTRTRRTKNQRPFPSRDESVELHDPYWLRAHKDWRFVAVVVLMLLAIATYVVTNDLLWRPHWMPIR